MKYKNLPGIAGIAGLFLLALVACGPQDADIQSAIQQKAATDPTMSGYSFTVEKGAVTVSGTAVSEADKASDMGAIKEVKGVKSVADNTTIAAAPAAPESMPVTISADDALRQGVTDATKDFPTVTATVQDGVITLNGELERARLQTLMQTLQGLNPRKVENKLTLK